MSASLATPAAAGRALGRRFSLRAPAHAFAALSAALGVAAAVLALTGQRSGTDAALAAAQSTMVCWLAALGWRRERSWTNIAVITAAAWVPTFLISSWAYAADPSLLDIGPPARAIATVNLSLLCLIEGYSWRRPADESVRASPPYVEVVATGLRRGRALAWALLGCAGFAAIFAVTGGPIHFITNVSNEGSLTAGRSYFVAAGMVLIFVVLAGAAMRWSQGRRLSWLERAIVTAAVLLTATLGARQEIAIPLAELTLYYALVRRRLPPRTMLAGLLVAGLVVVVGVGIVKRYGNYRQLHPGTRTGRLEFLITKGPQDFVDSYANNSADGVRLVALGESVVPAHASPEFGKEFLRFLLHPLPSGIRPTVPTAPAIKAALYPSTVDSYAQPLALVSYLQFTWVGLVVAFLVLGRVMAWLDQALLATVPRRPSTLLLLVAASIHVAVLVRIASANADAISLIEVFGLWLVARTCERELQP